VLIRNFQGWWRAGRVRREAGRLEAALLTPRVSIRRGMSARQTLADIGRPPKSPRIIKGFRDSGARALFERYTLPVGRELHGPHSGGARPKKGKNAIGASPAPQWDDTAFCRSSSTMGARELAVAITIGRRTKPWSISPAPHGVNFSGNFECPNSARIVSAGHSCIVLRLFDPAEGYSAGNEGGAGTGPTWLFAGMSIKTRPEAAERSGRLWPRFVGRAIVENLAGAWSTCLAWVALGPWRRAQPGETMKQTCCSANGERFGYYENDLRAGSGATGPDSGRRPMAVAKSTWTQHPA